MLPEAQICQRARRSRDPRFDGRFYVGVVTTGIYCRPICPARLPAEENVRYFASAAAAQEAGFRPCLRCRPETSRPLPEWTLGSTTVIRGLRLIERGFLDEHPVERLAERLGVSVRHLNRLFQTELGATPKSLARTRRTQLAKTLIDASNLPLGEIALTAGFGSVRRFNAELKAAYGCPPGDLRRRGRGRGRAHAPGDVVLRIPLREPYHRDWVFGFLEQRALPGLEEVQGHHYRRYLFRQGKPVGALAVCAEAGALRVSVPAAALTELGDVLVRVRRLFDLDADPHAVEEVLKRDPCLAPRLQEDPGLRVPGAWDAFEIAVRAVLGQQVSVARARNLAVALCEQFGAGDFPTAEALADADIAGIGMPGKRAQAIRALAAAVRDGALTLSETAQPRTLTEGLLALPGIGPWTAGYIGMRVGRDPDAFPEADWVVLKMLDMKAAAARQRAEAWRPWRAYAVMTLWRAAARARATGIWRRQSGGRPGSVTSGGGNER